VCACPNGCLGEDIGGGDLVKRPIRAFRAGQVPWR
jgi:hypothetical protein